MSDDIYVIPELRIRTPDMRQMTDVRGTDGSSTYYKYRIPSDRFRFISDDLSIHSETIYISRAECEAASLAQLDYIQLISKRFGI